jgi:hypothetical protein
MVSRSSSYTGAYLPLSRHVGRQPSTGNIDIPVPTLLRPSVDTSPPNEARRTTVEMSSPLSPLGLTGIPPATNEPNMVASSGYLRTVDQQTDTQAPNRRRANDSSSSRSRLGPLPPLLEDPLNPDIPVLLKSIPAQSTTRFPGERKPAHPFVARASSALSSELRRVYSWSSQSTSSTSGSSRRRLFGNTKSSQTTPDTSPEISNDSLLPGTWEPVSPMVLGLMDMAASDSEGLLRLAADGTVSAGNLEGLVSRVITDINDLSRSDYFRATFLTIYQLFATNERLFHILKRRFESSELDPVPARSRYPYVNNALPSNEY